MGLFPAQPFSFEWVFVGEGGRLVVLYEWSRGSPRMVARGPRAQHADHAVGQQALVWETSYFPQINVP